MLDKILMSKLENFKMQKRIDGSSIFLLPSVKYFDVFVNFSRFLSIFDYILIFLSYCTAIAFIVLFLSSRLFYSLKHPFFFLLLLLIGHFFGKILSFLLVTSSSCYSLSLSLSLSISFRRSFNISLSDSSTLILFHLTTKKKYLNIK